jgi:hypothetical protein
MIFLSKHAIKAAIWKKKYLCAKEEAKAFRHIAEVYGQRAVEAEKQHYETLRRLIK